MVEIKPEILKQAQAVTEESSKMALERRLSPDIRSIFAQMVREYVASLTVSGEIPSAADFSGEWNATFLRHYRRVGRVFLPNQRRSRFYEALFHMKQDLTVEQNQQLIGNYTRWSREFGSQQAGFVTSTNRDDYTTAFIQAREDAEGGSQAVVAAVAGIGLRQLFRGRVTTIANVQTQAPAEEAKREEAGALAAADGRGDDELTKTWRTVGDSNVRISHIAANGQVQSGNTAFTVGGENLRYPGDSSLGASLGNIVNCRCASIWS